jgi:hypothetical protein
MALNINGTTGISGVDGSASAPALQGTDSNTGINFGSDTVNINTGGSTRATVDSLGRLGIGTSSLGSYNANADNLVIVDSGHSGISVQSGASSNGVLAFTDGANTYWQGFVEYEHTGNNLKFGTNGDERMRITSSGHLTNTASNSMPTSGSGWGFTEDQLYLSTAGTSSNYALRFYNDNGLVGSVLVNGSGVTYNTSSDYRLKENVTAISDGITRLKTLKPSRFNFKADEKTTVDGFLAHEVSSLVPEAISGTKDEVDSNNNPVYQGIDQSKLVPLLTAALQEAIAKIETLETKVAALEAG